ncbi:roadblock/LC7 domain-containing protein [Streptomyces sp. NPDC018711]|uniref:roadblock/LC7 domain-containing protein n=1 Tax=Streptomyces sp. NPDC018711 TaxID=3365052 RepID=UPI00379A743F
MFADTHANTFGWLLDERFATLDGVECAVLLTTDGMLHSRTSSVSHDAAERHAAIASSLRGATHAYSEEFHGGGMRQLLLELNEYVCLITQAGPNALLLVQTSGPDVDLAAVAHQMSELAVSVGEEMAVEPRTLQPGGQAAG